MEYILIITNSYDLTADYIINKKVEGIEIFRFNTDNFNDYKIILSESGSYIVYNDRTLDLDTCKAIYYRKVTMPKLDDYDSNYKDYMYKEIFSVISGIAETFGKTVLTTPSVLRRADNKILQLKWSKKVGFKTATSLITNFDNAANKFITKFDESVIKPLSTGRIINGNNLSIIQTNLVQGKVTGLESSPAYFQEFLDKDYEVRVTVVNKDFFSVKIESSNKIDWRKSGTKISYDVINLPSIIKEKCLQIMDLANLKFAAFDFIVKDNEYYFLEFNANGQWLWLEKELNLRISDAIISYLIEGK